MVFDEAFKVVVGHEGGYVNDSQDPGGETKYGISKRQYPHLDIAALTFDEARQIYLIDYWNAMDCGTFASPVALVLFDCAVNQGVGRARKLAQIVAGVEVDGIIGPKTRAAIKAMDAREFVINYQAERMLHYAGLPTFGRFGRGWSRRLVATAIEATK